MNQPIPPEHTHPHLFAAFVLFSCFVLCFWPNVMRLGLDAARDKVAPVRMSDPFMQEKYLLNKQP